MESAIRILTDRQPDLQAFNLLVLGHQDWVYNLAYRILGDPQAAGDAAQEAFILAYKKLSSHRGSSFRAWISRIVANVCYDELRRARRRPTLPFSAYDRSGEEVESPYWIVDTGESPEEQIIRGELRDELQACLNQLPAEYRLAVVLVDVMDLGYAEAAQILGRPEGTVKSRLARGRRRLRDLIRIR